MLSLSLYRNSKSLFFFFVVFLDTILWKSKYNSPKPKPFAGLTWYDWKVTVWGARFRSAPNSFQLMTFQGCSQICFVEPHLSLNWIHFLEAALYSVVFHAFTLCALVLKRKTFSLKCGMIRKAEYFIKNGELFFFFSFVILTSKVTSTRNFNLVVKWFFRV